MNISWPFIKRATIASTVMLISMLVLWFFLWALGAAQYRDFVDNWIETHRNLGYQVTYDKRETTGFPRHISLHYSNFVLQNPDGVKVHANEVLLSAFPWQWNHFDAKLKRGFELSIPFSGEKTLHLVTDQTARNHTELDVNGDWTFVDLELADAKALWGNDPFFSAGNFSIAFKRPEHAPRDHTETGLTFGAMGENLLLPPEYSAPFGQKLEKIDVALRIMGSPPDPRKKESVAAWNTGNNVVEFDKFYLEWGPLILMSRGTLGLDDDLQPEGAFSGQIGHHMDVIKVLMNQDYIPKRQEGMLDHALNLFAKKTKISGAEGIEMPITVQLQGLFMGPVRVFEFPVIAWDDTTRQDQAPATQAPAAAPRPAPAPTSDSPAR